jgi:hypothetical protein
MDFHLESLNLVLKTDLKHLGFNVTDSTAKQEAWALQGLQVDSDMGSSKGLQELVDSQ